MEMQSKDELDRKNLYGLFSLFLGFDDQRFAFGIIESIVGFNRHQSVNTEQENT